MTTEGSDYTAEILKKERMILEFTREQLADSSRYAEGGSPVGNTDSHSDAVTADDRRTAGFDKNAVAWTVNGAITFACMRRTRNIAQPIIHAVKRHIVKAMRQTADPKIDGPETVKALATINTSDHGACDEAIREIGGRLSHARTLEVLDIAVANAKRNEDLHRPGSVQFMALPVL